MPEIVLVTRSGDFSLDAMSGGVAALFGISWQLLMFGWGKSECTVLFDEPENHLHPSMQRELLPSLLKAYPGYTFIVATHSPFVVSSAHDATVYALTYNKENRVTGVKCDDADLSGSANSVLRDILGVKSTIPVWVEEKLKAVLQKVNSGAPITAEELYMELKQQGLEASPGEFVPKA